MRKKHFLPILALLVCAGLGLNQLISMIPQRLKFPMDLPENPRVINGGGLLARRGDYIYYCNNDDNGYLYKKGDGADESLSTRWGADNIYLMGDAVIYRARGIHSVDIYGNNQKTIDRRDTFDTAAIEEYFFYSAQTKGTWDNIRKINMFCYNAKTGRRYLVLKDASIYCVTKFGIYFDQVLSYSINKKKDNTGWSSRFCFLDFSTGEVSVISDQQALTITANNSFVYYRNSMDGLYRANLDMSDPVRIADSSSLGLAVNEEYVFFWEKNMLVRTDLYGGNKTQIFDSEGEIADFVALTESEILIQFYGNVGDCYIMDLNGENVRIWHGTGWN